MLLGGRTREDFGAKKGLNREAMECCETGGRNSLKGEWLTGVQSERTNLERMKRRVEKKRDKKRCGPSFGIFRTSDHWGPLSETISWGTKRDVRALWRNGLWVFQGS